MVSTNEEAQLAQTIEMFEVITQSQPQDYQSLEILKEAYAKLGRETDVVNTSKRIAKAYVLMGQLSSAILEYESILQRYPDDAEALKALGEIESKANTLNTVPIEAPVEEPKPAPVKKGKSASRIPAAEVDDGRVSMHKIFVEGKIISNAHFELCWVEPDMNTAPARPIDPFVQMLAEKGLLPVEKSLRILSDKARLAYLPLDKYDVDIEFARSFPADTCRRWCVLPFDRLSKCVLVATTNPFNRHVASEIETASKHRVLWYLAQPQDIVANLRKTFR